jgi:hypothetical protein
MNSLNGNKENRLTHHMFLEVAMARLQQHRELGLRRSGKFPALIAQQVHINILAACAFSSTSLSQRHLVY